MNEFIVLPANEQHSPSPMLQHQSEPFAFAHTLVSLALAEIKKHHSILHKLGWNRVREKTFFLQLEALIALIIGEGFEFSQQRVAAGVKMEPLIAL